MKKCYKCNTEKPKLDFYKNKAQPDGYQTLCKECILSIAKYNRDNNNKYAKEYRIKNKEKIAERNRIYAQKNKDKLNEYQKAFKKHQIKNDSFYRTKNRIRSRTYNAFKASSWQKNSGTEQLLGATYEVVFNHLESRFTNGMSWENQGEWHIDHIIPLSSATTEEELIQLCHYTNLQPLWAEDNFKKGDKILATNP